MAEMSGETVDNKTKLEIIKHEEEIIAAEKEELAKEAKVRKLIFWKTCVSHVMIICDLSYMNESEEA